MGFINGESIKELANPDVVSRQLLNPDNSASKRATITEVHLEVGASQPRHTHDASEQIWCAVKRTGKLLLSDDKKTEFIYISVIAPPINFGYAYQEKR